MTILSGIHELFERQTARSPAAIAVRCGNSCLSYQELNTLADRVASSLMLSGIKQGTVVAMLLPQSVYQMVALLGILKSGCIYVPIDTAYPEERITYLLKDSEANAVICSRENEEQHTGCQVFLIEDMINGELTSNLYEQRLIRKNELAYIIYTSGSTGKPKGVMITHESIIKSTEERLSYYQFQSFNFLLLSSIAFDSSLAGIFWTFSTGGELIILPKIGLLDPYFVIQQIQRHQVHGFLCIPNFYHELIPVIASTEHQLQFVIVAGENCANTTVEKHRSLLNHVDLYNEYGPTEACVWASVAKLHGTDDRNTNSIVTIGKPISINEFYVIDELGHIASDGQAGELCIAGINLARGYSRDEKLTQSKFIYLTPNYKSVLVYKTGDLVRKLEDGRYEYLGRIDEQIKVNGHRIELKEIEECIRQFPGVADVIVSIIHKAASRIELVANIVFSAPIQIKEVSSFIQQKLPNYMHPASYRVWESFPLTPNGKIDKRVISANCQIETIKIAREEKKPPEIAKTIESKITKAMSQLFDRNDLTKDSDFFALGGDSIDVIRFIVEARKQGLILTAQQIFSHSTIAGLSDLARENAIINKTKIVSHELPLVHSITPMQQGLHLQNLISSEHEDYFIQDTYLINETMDQHVFTHAWNVLVDQFEILRTGYIIDSDGAIKRVVMKNINTSLSVINWDEELEDLINEKLENLLQQDKLKRFNLSQPPLARIKLVYLPNNQSLILLSMHHILMDGWSIALLMASLLDQYTILKHRLQTKITRLQGDKQYLVWLSKQDKAKANIFWQTYLQHYYQNSSLINRLSYYQSEESAASSSVYCIHLNKESTRRLHYLSIDNKVTLNSILQLAWGILLTKYLQQDDIIFGVVVSGRHIPLDDVENMLGLFINTLPLRLKIESNKTIRDMLKVSQEAIAALQQFSYLTLAEIQSLSQTHHHTETGIFDHFMAFMNHPDIAILREHETPSLVSSKLGAVKTEYPLSIAIYPTETISIEFIYDKTQVDETALIALAQQYSHLLNRMTFEVDIKISELPLVSDADMAMINQINQSNATLVSEPALHEYIGHYAALQPNKTAVIAEGIEYSYSEIEKTSNQIAEFLEQQNAMPGDKIAVCIDRGMPLIVTMLAIHKLGLVYVSIDTALPMHRIQYILEDCHPLLVILQNSANDFSSLAKCITVEQLFLEIKYISASPVYRLLAKDRDFYIVYTSGSTGSPKGVINTYNGMENRIQWSVLEYHGDSSIRLLHCSGTGFDISIWEMYFPLVTGGTVVITPQGLQRDPVYILQQISSYQITMVHFVPSILSFIIEELKRDKSYNVSSVRSIVCGGEYFSTELHNKVFTYFEAKIYHTYGPSEASISVTNWTSSSPVPFRRLPLGTPIANVKIYIFDQSMKLCPIGVPGEIYISGIAVSSGYLNKSDLNAKAFITEQVPNTYGKLYKTGDFGRYLANGMIEFLGRKDNQVKLRGIRIELSDIDENLTAHPSVETSVSLIVGNGENAKLISYVVPENQCLQTSVKQESDYIDAWRRLYNDIYSDNSNYQKEFNTVGWRSSYTGEQITNDEMREWLDLTIERIITLKPRSVLDLGCGTGLILYRLAPLCDNYTAVDFSEAVISQLVDSIRDQADYKNVCLIQNDILQAAVELADKQYDLIIINSVLQYLPSEKHVIELIEKCIKLLTPDGKLYLGDIRNFDYLFEHYLSVISCNTPQETTLYDLKSDVLKAVYAEEELLLSPSLFLNMPKLIPSLADVRILLKKGQYVNEMNKFRYDVIIRKSAPLCFNCDTAIDIADKPINLNKIEHLLSNKKIPSLQIRNIKNARLMQEITLTKYLLENHHPETTLHEFKNNVASLTSDVLHPHSLYELGKKYQYHVEITISDFNEKGLFDAYLWQTELFAHSTLPFFNYENLSDNTSNNSHLKNLSYQLEPQLRVWLQNRLPGYMIPNHIVVLDKIPLNQNDKISFEQLRDMSVLVETINVVKEKPRNIIESKIHEIWCELLGLDEIDIQSNFFSLGGHSLLASTMLIRLNEQFGTNLPIRIIFSHPTIEGIASLLAPQAQTFQFESITRRADSTLASPVSSAQKRLWILDKLLPDTSMYNMPSIYRISGNISIEAIKKAFDKICARHEILRTIFKANSSGIYQQVLNEPHYLFNYFLSIKDYVEPINEICRYQFNLENGPLLTVNLLTIGHYEHILVINMPHIISDGWSIKVLFDELARFYNQFTTGIEIAVEDLPIQYADYAIWHNNTLVPSIFQEQIEYWQQQLAKAPDTIAFPFDFKRPVTRSFSGKIHHLTIENSLYKAIKDLSEHMHCTLYIMLLCIFKLLISKYTLHEDIIVGTPAANRHYTGVERLIGFFVNILPIRSRLRKDRSFKDNLAAVKNIVFEAISHQDIPLEEVVKALNIRQDLSRHPIFQFVFALEKMEASNQDFHQLLLKRDDVSCTLSKFDLTLRIYEFPERLQCEFEYSTELFLPETIAQFANHFASLIRIICDNSDIKPNDFHLYQYPNQYHELSEHDTKLCWPQLFDKTAETYPENCALEYRNSKISYQSLRKLTDEKARIFQSMGIGCGEIVAICLPRSPELFINAIAIMKAGAAYLPLDSDYPDSRIHYMLQDSNAKFIITNEEYASRFATLKINIIKLTDNPVSISPILQYGSPEVSENSIAYVIYTSGSTGKPKGVMVQHKGLTNLAIQHSHNFSIHSDSKMLQFSSFSFDASVLEFCTTLSTGATLVIADREVLLGDHLVETMNKHLVTIAMPSPSLLALLHAPVIPSLKTLVLGGECSAPSVIRYWLGKGVEVINSYGPTEVTVCACFYKYQHNDIRPWNTIGKPFKNVEVYILDEDKHPVPIGVPGQLFIGGIGVSLGYLNQNSLTSEKFIEFELTNIIKKRIYATGDLVKQLPCGNLEYLGRVDNQVKIRGFRIELGEIEASINAQNHVFDCVVVMQDENGDKYITAYVILDKEVETYSLLNKIKSELNKWLPSFMVPRYIIPLDTFPLTLNGKVDRQQLAAMKIRQSFIEQTKWPLNPYEYFIVKTFEQVLNVLHINVTDDFFEHGGHSLTAIQAIHKINTRFNISLPMTTIFKLRTPADLASCIDNNTLNDGRLSCYYLNEIRTGKPLVLIHPVQGTSSCYLSLASKMKRPLIGFDNPFIGQKSFTSIETMAYRYVKDLLSFISEREFDLAGWSFGGVVAIEMAKILQKQRICIPNVVLIDSFNFSQFTDFDENHLSKDIANEFLTHVNTDNKDIVSLITNEIIHNKSLAIKYQPAAIHSKITLLRSSTEEKLFGIDKRYYKLNGWESLFPNIRTFDLTGSHHRLFDEDKVEEIYNIFDQKIGFKEGL